MQSWLIVRLYSPSFAPGFFDIAKKVNLLKSCSISTLSYISFIISVTLLISKSWKLAFGLTVLFLFNLTNANLNSDSNTTGPSTYLYSQSFAYKPHSYVIDD